MSFARKPSARWIAGKIGLVLRWQLWPEDLPTDADPPPLLDHPLDAVVAQRCGIGDRFACSVGSIVMLNGLGFARHSWHPFSAVLQHNSDATRYEDTVLARFYEAWQPSDAAHAVVGFSSAPALLASCPAYGYHYTPWSDLPLAAVLDQIRLFHAADCAEHGKAELDIDRDGFKHHGPVSPSLGETEHRRLMKVHSSLAHQGYDRRNGDVNVYVLRRGAEHRVVCRGGVHRVAALAALDQNSVPACLRSPYLVDRQDLQFWPQVRNGNWSVESAGRYFDHLFDFDARLWARQQGLLAT
jgi:hypothetical protein